MELNQHEWHHKQIDNKILKKIKTEILKKWKQFVITTENIFKKLKTPFVARGY